MTFVPHWTTDKNCKCSWCSKCRMDCSGDCRLKLTDECTGFDRRKD